MQTPFLIFIRALGIYALLTLPTIVLPFMYIISLLYAASFGWFSWALFTIIYLVIDGTRTQYHTRMALLILAVIVSVAFSYQMIQVFRVEVNVWQSEYIWFPGLAVLAGWISLGSAKKMVIAACPGYSEFPDFLEEVEVPVSNSANKEG